MKWWIENLFLFHNNYLVNKTTVKHNHTTFMSFFTLSIICYNAVFSCLRCIWTQFLVIVTTIQVEWFIDMILLCWCWCYSIIINVATSLQLTVKGVQINLLCLKGLNTGLWHRSHTYLFFSTPSSLIIFPFFSVFFCSLVKFRSHKKKLRCRKKWKTDFHKVKCARKDNFSHVCIWFGKCLAED